MYIHLNDIDGVQGYTGFTNLEDEQLRMSGLIFVEDAALPVGFVTDFWPGRWRYANGAFSETDVPAPSNEREVEIEIALSQQIADLQMAVVELYEEVLGHG